MKVLDCSTKEREYWSHVSQQQELPIAVGVDALPLVTELGDLAKGFPLTDTKKAQIAFLKVRLLRDPSLIHQLRLLVSVSDKRLYLELSYVFSRTPSPMGGGTLCGCLPHELSRHPVSFFENKLKSGGVTPGVAAKTAEVLSQYLLEKGVAEIIGVYAGLTQPQRETIIKCLILPKEIQQNEAKRRGHGAEAEVAKLLRALKAQYLPADKIEHPMGSRDPNVDFKTLKIVPRSAGATFGFDLLVMDRGDIRICIQGLVQSSDPGQFGVDKSNQTVDIRRIINAANSHLPREKKLELWGILDGVGYSENKKDTINKMLANVHKFIQMKSLYKAALALHRLGLANITAIRFDPDFYSASAMQHMTQYVPKGVTIITSDKQIDSRRRAVQAGKAIVYV